MLLANPHLPRADFMLFYESQWQGPREHLRGDAGRLSRARDRIQ